jgi:tRNA pseudouridine13 synthase
LFNDVLAKRIDSIGKLLDGDIAYKHDNGACFHVETAATEQPRADAFEISPTGPLVGYRMTAPTGEPGKTEQEAMAAVSLTPADFRQSGKMRVKGARRPLRVKPENIEIAGGVDEFGQHITVAFTLPAGAFATVLIRELIKNDLEEAVTQTSGGESDEAETESTIDSRIAPSF